MKFRIDTVTKLLLLLYAGIAVFLFYSFALETMLVLLVFILQMMLCRRVEAVGYPAVYFGLAAVWMFLLPHLPGRVAVMVSVFAVAFLRLFPCVMAGRLLITTTGVAELMSCLERFFVPRQVIIPLTVTLRYLPAAKEELSHIRDAKRMRESAVPWQKRLSHPLERLEDYYVPILLSAAQISEELTEAALARGIENPKKRTNLYESRISLSDGLVWALLAAATVAAAMGIM